MAHYTSETDAWNFGFGRTRTRGRSRDDADNRDDEHWLSRSPPLVFGGIRPPFLPGDFLAPYYGHYGPWEDIYWSESREGRGRGRRKRRDDSGGAGETAVAPPPSSSPSKAVIPAPKAAPDASRFEIIVRDTTDNRLPAWPENTTWKAGIAKNTTIPTIIKHITANPAKYMVTVVWSNLVEEELHDAIKVVDLERDARELRVRLRESGPPSLPMRLINA
ncbi:hypothetical protein E4U42_004764 [Claviceps africana]|uniref:Uncharacterized protein n=1 Tax=Claviceps africana TaxID=83212 RepID=A0A8K0J5C1_9HYPO|nr:hypothetical protein E4U42_004764 [Claviceps africana]